MPNIFQSSALHDDIFESSSGGWPHDEGVVAAPDFSMLFTTSSISSLSTCAHPVPMHLESSPTSREAHCEDRGCAAAARRMRGGCAMTPADAPWMPHGCAQETPRMLYRCALDAPKISRCPLDAPWTPQMRPGCPVDACDFGCPADAPQASAAHPWSIQQFEISWMPHGCSPDAQHEPF